MSLPQEESILDADDNDPSKKTPDEPWNEPNDCLLPLAFEEQMRLVEKSIRDSVVPDSIDQPKKNRVKKNKKGQHQSAETTPSSTNKYQQQQKTADKKGKQQPTGDDTQKHNDSNNIFTNRSRIYRYEGRDKVVEDENPILTPPTIDCSNIHEATDDKQAQQKMLMSWYVAGFNTGYYEAMKKYRKSSDN